MKNPALNLVFYGGCLLAFGAACVNVVFIMEVGVSISHMSGDMSRIGIGLSEPNAMHAAAFLNVAASFLGFGAGSVAAGFLLHHPTLEMKRPYGWLVAGIGLLLLLANQLLIRSLIMPAVFAGGLACGFQNSLATRYRGMVLRTTHVTGLITELGVVLGMMLRGRQIDGWKLLVPALLIIFFLLGALCGGALLHLQLAQPLNLVGGSYVVCGLGRGLLRWTHTFRKETQHAKS